MKNLRFYETDAAFKAYEQGAGGDGNSTKTSIPGVSSAWDLGKTYFNPHDEAKLTHTVTVKYVSIFDGTELADSETIEIKYLSGVTQEIVLNAKTLDGYVAINDKSIVHVPDDTEINFFYKYTIISRNPLTFNILSSGTIYWKAQNIAYTTSIEYKKNNGEWTIITSNTGASVPIISVNDGDVVQFKGDNAAYSDIFIGNNSFSGTTAKFELEGNIMSLINSENFATATTLASSYTFGSLFSYCTGLTSSERLVLPATTLADSCYQGMFVGCTSLTAAPELPATTLAVLCYGSMFSGCTNLTSAPELPATTLASECYSSMFYGCSSLTTAPELPATTLMVWCYRGMFSGCTSLTTAPELPATTLTYGCYESMFNGCISLTKAPSILPATSLAQSCYSYMFYGCASLTEAPELPATSLAQSCYSYMFYGCASLTEAPELPATTLASSCYYDMFDGCTSLTTAPALPATTLANNCYGDMFYNCTSLTTAPELPATTLTDYCYRYMFFNCTSLNYIKCLATNISASRCTYNWVRGVASTGTFVKNPNISSWTTGNNGIPANWTVQNA